MRIGSSSVMVEKPESLASDSQSEMVEQESVRESASEMEDPLSDEES